MEKEKHWKPKKSTIKDQVYEIIRQMILTQEFPIGSKINIDTLAQTLKVSNSPIREALTMLEKHGLVVNKANVGSSVISFSPKRLSEICATLHIIAIGSYHICQRDGHIEQAVKTMEEALALQDSLKPPYDMNLSVKYALMYDKCLVEATENEYLLSLFEQMEDVYFLLALHNRELNYSQHEENVIEHREILDAIKEENTPLVEELFLSHYTHKFEALDEE